MEDLKVSIRSYNRNLSFYLKVAGEFYCPKETILLKLCPLQLGRCLLKGQLLNSNKRFCNQQIPRGFLSLTLGRLVLSFFSLS